MNIMDGINSFLMFVNDNWTSIVVLIGLFIGFCNKAKRYLNKSDEEKISIAKACIHQGILKMITDAELDYEEWKSAGSIKRSQVIQEIYERYPILASIIDQQAVINWIDDEIDSALKTLREVIKNNKTTEEPQVV